ncbi:MAG: DUF1456 family protein [Spirochaetales bacterium]|nr:DUF1456 family protein [Spirochaetales bacterium]
MDNNDFLRRLRYALNIQDAYMVSCFKEGGADVSASELKSLFLREEDDEFLPCTSRQLEQFLDGLILLKRGPRKEGSKPPPATRLTNNLLLKKIRIALEFKEEDMLEILKLGEFPLSKAELSALFRKEGHKHYMDCGDQILKRFLKGLPLYLKTSTSK